MNSSPSRDARELEALSTVWRAHGLSLDALDERPDGTLSASDRQLTLAAEDAIPEQAGALVREPLVIGEQLGRGGMGVVQSATQLALRREVAVKRVHDGGSPRAMQNLLKEAWIGGALQHPNIVPVHALANLGGQPAVVMKRVEGETWRRRMRRTREAGLEAQEAAFDADLDVLVAVCRAMELAHARGILHLDLKPDNVMVGGHGEVYVVDWGLAAGFGPQAPSWLPSTEAIRSVAGTPDYMPPELASGAAPNIGPRSDVYLLGAMLHEAVTGEPPHTGKSTVQRLYKAYLSQPAAYDEAVDPELAKLLHRAMDADRNNRFSSVVAFREALEAFRGQRQARELVSEAERALVPLRALLTGPDPDEVEVWQRFGACRFALREARRAWTLPDDEPVTEVGETLYEAMARWAVEQGRLDLAEAYLAELTSAPAALVKAVEEQRDEAARAVARERSLEELAFHEDITLGVTFRRQIGLLLGLTFIGVNVAMGTATRLGAVELGYREMLVTGAITFVVLGPFALVARRKLFRNRANAALFTIAMSCFFALQGIWAVGLMQDIPFRAALALTPICYLLTFGAIAMLVNPRFLPAAVLQLISVGVVLLLPEFTYEAIGLFGGLSAIFVGFAVPRQAEPSR